MEAPAYKKSVPREYFEAIVLAVILALFFRTFVIEAFKIPSSSMEDNLLVGDHILVNKFAYAPVNFEWERTLLPIHTVQRTDVIVFKYPQEPERNFIKRVIGLGNETVEIRNKQLYINGKELQEPYKFHKAEFFGLTAENFGPVMVPQGYYFVLGDNRDNSKDSRAWGFVPKDHIKGRAFIIYWSFEDDKYLQPSDMTSRFRGYINVIVNFIPKTRWKRFFKVIE